MTSGRPRKSVRRSVLYELADANITGDVAKTVAWTLWDGKSYVSVRKKYISYSHSTLLPPTYLVSLWKVQDPSQRAIDQIWFAGNYTADDSCWQN